MLQNPEVQARWHAFQAGAHMVDVARGGLLPRVDLSAGTGRERLNQADSVGNDANYNRNTYSVGLTQLVYDGFGTTSEVRRLGKAKLTRYYELLDASENVALEAARAYYDVLRHRFLLALSEDNYVYHKATYEQLLMRAQSGVGRRVDVEQAASRLALAEVNLTTDQANLHDVTARYQRIVGEAPAQNMFAAEGLAGRLPGRADQALQQAFQTSPALLAAVENVEAAQYDLDVRKSAFHPKVELRASQNRTSNYLGSSEERRDNVVELVLNYNLFNGGSDQARTRQYAEQRHVALDQREKACRDLRQTVSIAYNDTQWLQEQLAFLESQVQMTERTR
ncbi:MAG: TolC family protein, partial [Azovibrio sp.]|nr:TolC family protein [Azovibrio sp.]